jgi:hypothetical protein
VLALIFPAGGFVLFIPWRLAAEFSRRIFYLALGGGAGAVGRAQVWGRAQRQAVATALTEPARSLPFLGQVPQNVWCTT